MIQGVAARLFQDPEERHWVYELSNNGWVQNGKPDSEKKFDRWSRKNGLSQIKSDGRTIIAWQKNWFNPKIFTWDPKISFLTSYVDPRPESDLIGEIRDHFGVSSVELAHAIIDFWIEEVDALQKDGNMVSLSPNHLTEVVEAEDALKEVGRIMTQIELDEKYNREVSFVPKENRLEMHGVIVDLDYLRINEEWVFNLTRSHGNAIATLDFAKIAPLNLDRIEKLTNPQRLEITKAVCENLARRFPNSGITANDAVVQIGNSEEVAKYFLPMLSGLLEQVDSSLTQGIIDLKDATKVMGEEEGTARKRRVGARRRVSEGQSLTLKAAVLQKFSDLSWDNEI